MPHIYFLIEFSLLYIIRDICVYSSMIRFISSYLHTHTHMAHSPSRALPVNRFIASRIKQSAHRLNCSFGIFPLLFCWRSSVQIVARQHFSIEHFVHTLQNALVVHYNRLSVAHKHRAYALCRCVAFGTNKATIAGHQCWWWWLIVNWFRCAARTQPNYQFTFCSDKDHENYMVNLFNKLYFCEYKRVNAAVRVIDSSSLKTSTRKW